MKAALFFLVLVNEAMVLAAPAIELNNDAPPSSGCYLLLVDNYLVISNNLLTNL